MVAARAGFSPSLLVCATYLAMSLFSPPLSGVVFGDQWFGCHSSMRLSVVLLCLGAAGALIVRADYSAYAPPMMYGPVSAAAQGVVGDCWSRVIYDIEVLGDTSVSCQVMGTGYSYNGAPCTFGFYDGGLANGPIEITWSSVAANPSIQCMGMGLGAHVRWNYRLSSGKSYCPIYCKQKFDFAGDRNDTIAPDA